MALGLLYGDAVGQDKKAEARVDKPNAEAPAPASAALAQQAEKAERYRNPCGYDETHDDSDLCAQWRAANAAESSFRWMKSLYWLNLVEAFGVVASLSLSALAAIAGLRAAKAAEDQLESADRPHVMYDFGGISSLAMFPVPNHLLIYFRWTNYGKGPCWTRSYGVGQYCGPPGVNPPISKKDLNDHKIAWPLAPTGNWQIFQEYPLTLAIPHDAIMDIALGQRDLWIALYITYVDSDDRLRESRTVLRYEPMNDRLVPVDHPFLSGIDAGKT